MNHETRAGRGRAAKACLTTALGLALALVTALPASAVDITPAPKTDDYNTQNLSLIHI